MLDTDSDIVFKEEYGGKLKFESNGNACAAVEENKVVALVTGDDWKTHLVEYTLGA